MTICIADPCFGICIHVVTVIKGQGLEEVCVGQPALEKRIQHTEFEMQKRANELHNKTRSRKREGNLAHCVQVQMSGRGA